MKTLEEILKASEKPSVSETLKALATSLKQEDEDRVAGFAPLVDKLMALVTQVNEKVDALCAKPDVVFPEPKEFPSEIAITKPDWYKEPEESDMSWVPNLTNSVRYDGDKTRKVLMEILDKLNEEPPILEEKSEPKTVNSAAVRSRRTTQWKRFDNYDQKNLINPSGDGVTWFMPDSLIPNSETVKLDGAVSMLNNDYTLIGNKILFVNNQTGSQIEIRGQVK